MVLIKILFVVLLTYLSFSNSAKTTIKIPLNLSIEFNKYCKPDTFHSIPHPSNCTLFILCFNGEAIVRNCDNDTHFSARYSSCLPPREAQCTSDGTICPPSFNISDIVVAENIYDCNSYYVCLNGSPVLIQCDVGQHWNHMTATCVPEEHSDCKAFDNPFTEAPTPEEPTTTEVTTPELTTRDIENICSGLPPQFIVPHPDDCTKYIYCNNGQASTFTCGPGQLFDAKLLKCVKGEASCFT